MISVIVPTHDEEQLLPRCLRSVRNQGVECEVIVADGASCDDTLAIAGEYADTVIPGERPNLPAQLNAGAAAAKGDVLLFLHADCYLAPGCLARIEDLPPDVAGGAFTMRLDGRRLAHRILSAGGNAYCRLTGTLFGDRGMFLRASVFAQLGGFTDIPIMSDVDLSHRLRRAGRTVLLPGPVVSSARKFEGENPLRSLYLIFYALGAFRLGVDPEAIAGTYYRR